MCFVCYGELAAVVFVLRGSEMVVAGMMEGEREGVL